jgi:hypothetical protein
VFWQPKVNTNRRQNTFRSKFLIADISHINQFYFVSIVNEIHPYLPPQRGIAVTEYSTDLFPIQGEQNKERVL